MVIWDVEAHFTTGDVQVWTGVTEFHNYGDVRCFVFFDTNGHHVAIPYSSVLWVKYYNNQS